jgi:regulator of sigma E protease
MDPRGDSVRRVREDAGRARRTGVAPAERERAFNRQNVWRRIFIVVAGPVFNLLFAIAVYTGLFLYGLPSRARSSGSRRRALSRTQPGLRAGDTVRAVGGEPIATWQELRWRVIQGALQRESLVLEVSNEREAIAQRKLDIDCVSGGGLRGRRTGAHRLAPVSSSAATGVRHDRARAAPAERAGLKVGRSRCSRQGARRISIWEELVQAIRARPGCASCVLAIERNGERSTIEVVPETANAGRVQIGGSAPRPSVPEAHAERILVTRELRRARARSPRRRQDLRTSRSSA